MYNLNQVSGKAIDNIIGNIVTKNVYFPNVTSLAINGEKTYKINVSLNTTIELFLQNGTIVEDTPGKEFFEHPKTKRAEEFLESMEF